MSDANEVPPLSLFFFLSSYAGDRPGVISLIRTLAHCLCEGDERRREKAREKLKGVMATFECESKAVFVCFECIAKGIDTSPHKVDKYCFWTCFKDGRITAGTKWWGLWWDG